MVVDVRLCTPSFDQLINRFSLMSEVKIESKVVKGSMKMNSFVVSRVSQDHHKC
jgi:hypothetical protein